MSRVSPYRPIHMAALTLIVGALAACEAPPTEPAALAAEGILTAGAVTSARADGYRVVIVRQGPGTDASSAAGAPVVDNLADALARVAAGGTIRLGAGTYAGGVTIDKPVTLQGRAADEVFIDGTHACWSIAVEGVTDGTVSIRQLGFVGTPFCGHVVVGNAYDQVMIERSDFGGSIVVLRGGPADGRSVTIRDSRLAGASITGNDVPDVRVVGNAFTGAGATVSLTSESHGRIEANTFNDCFLDGSTSACITVGRLAPSTGPGGGLAVLGNTVTVDIANQGPSGILAGGGSHRIEHNAIVGVGRDPDAADLTLQFPFTLAGIEVVDGADAVVSRNSVENAFFGLQFGSPVVATGKDNRVTDVHIGVQSFPDSDITVRSSDFERYAFAMQINEGDPSRTNLTCNWWGSASGPKNPGGPDPSVFTPWATEPVAGRSVIDCDGGPPTIVRVDPTAPDFEADPPTFETVAEALAAVAPAGTILVADGTHVARDLHVNKPVTIQAEGPGRPVIDAEDASGAFAVGQVTDGPVTFRGLEIINGVDANIYFSGSIFDRVVIEDNVLHAASGKRLSSAVFSLGKTGNEVVIRGNEVLGGQVGIHADFSNGLIEDNTFSGQAVNSIRFGGMATDLRVVGNTLVCGGMTESCLSLVPVGDVDVIGNEVTVDFTDPVDPAPIQVSATAARVKANTVTGVGGTGDPTDPASFPIRGAAIALDAADAATISGNTVRNAFLGLTIGSDVIAAAGLDNVVDGSSVPITIATGGAASIRSSDFTRYGRALVTFVDSEADLTCNWWGSTDGPVNPEAPDPSVFTPWATEPVAGTSTTTCSGGL